MNEKNEPLKKLLQDILDVFVDFRKIPSKQLVDLHILIQKNCLNGNLDSLSSNITGFGALGIQEIIKNVFDTAQDFLERKIAYEYSAAEAKDHYCDFFNSYLVTPDEFAYVIDFIDSVQEQIEKFQEPSVEASTNLETIAPTDLELIRLRLLITFVINQISTFKGLL